MLLQVAGRQVDTGGGTAGIWHATPSTYTIQDMTDTYLSDLNSKIVNVFKTYKGFMAKKWDGSIITWGDSRSSSGSHRTRFRDSRELVGYHYGLDSQYLSLIYY